MLLILLMFLISLQLPCFFCQLWVRVRLNVLISSFLILLLQTFLSSAIFYQIVFLYFAKTALSYLSHCSSAYRIWFLKSSSVGYFLLFKLSMISMTSLLLLKIISASFICLANFTNQVSCGGSFRVSLTTKVPELNYYYYSSYC